MGKLKVYGNEVMPGEHKIITIPVTRDLGVDIRMKAHLRRKLPESTVPYGISVSLLPRSRRIR